MNYPQQTVKLPKGMEQNEHSKMVGTALRSIPHPDRGILSEALVKWPGVCSCIFQGVVGFIEVWIFSSVQ